MLLKSVGRHSHAPGNMAGVEPTWNDAEPVRAEHMHASCRRAVEHVAVLAAGPPIESSLRITLNFHPDRAATGAPILRAIADTGTYLSQFATGTSNGGLTAYPGGDRWRWEQSMFGGAYDDAPAHARPVYGGLNFRLKQVGAAPRFGSAHLRLTEETVARATFRYPDSNRGPTAFGVADRMSLVELAVKDEQDALDDYIEAHVHGPVRIDRDVEALVLDPSYLGTDVESDARCLPCPIDRHWVASPR